jgi:hypothetical protein
VGVDGFVNHFALPIMPKYSNHRNTASTVTEYSSRATVARLAAKPILVELPWKEIFLHGTLL